MTEKPTLAAGQPTATDDATALVSGDSSPSGEPDPGRARSLTSDAWAELRGKKIFWFSLVLIAFFVLMAIVPGLFSRIDPTATFDVRRPPSGDHWFGTDGQGYDILSRTVHGARASLIVGIATTIFTAVVGVAVGVLAAYTGGWVDAVVSRITDVFFALPLLLGGILFLSAFPNTLDTPYLVVVGKVVLVLGVLGWPNIARLMRGATLQVLPQEYVQAARAMGAGPWRIIRRHIIPNAIAPVLVVSTINLGVYIVAEASLSFLGIGLVPPAISWGVAIDEALGVIRTRPHMLFFPAIALSLCVLAFIMLGDALRDAFDPKSR